MSPNVHSWHRTLHTPPKFHEKTPRGREKERKWGREREKKGENLGGLAEGGPAGGRGGSRGGGPEGCVCPEGWCPEGWCNEGWGPRRVEPRTVGPRRVEVRRVKAQTEKKWGPEGWERAKIFAFFFPSPATVFILSSSLGGRFVEFWWCD